MSRKSNVLIRILTGLAALAVLCVVSVEIVQQYQDSQRVDSVALVREVHDHLPLGSSITDVQQFLAERDIEHSKNVTGREIDAIVPNVKGSSFFTRDDLSVSFHFDYAGNLASIDTRHQMRKNTLD